MSIRDFPVLSIFSLATAALAGLFCCPEQTMSALTIANSALLGPVTTCTNPSKMSATKASRQNTRHELQEAREACWNSDRRWWKPDQRRWHTDRDDNDHRDYDHQHRGDNRNYDLTRH
jgi:hypothetical protein